jgi:hypothetical protein
VNKFERNDAFNSEGIRKAMADIKVKPSLEGADGKPVVEMSRLARQTANRLSQENYSPTMIIGSLRLAEFALLALTGFVVHALYVGLSSDSTVYLYYPGHPDRLDPGGAADPDCGRLPGSRAQKRPANLAQGAECLDDCLRHYLRAGILHAVRPGFLQILVCGLVCFRRGRTDHRAAISSPSASGAGPGTESWSGGPSSSAAAKSPRA